ncbi:MAG: hypothetical protein R3E32_26280 [Chitinophagales bacterium]
MKNIPHFSSKRVFALLFMLSLVTFFHACVKDEDIAIETTLLPDAKELIRTNIFGLVVDENDLPVVNSEVFLQTDQGFEVTTTDENGNFLYLDVQVVREGAFLKVREAGKFEGFRKMNVTPNSYNYTKIKLLDKTIVGTVASTTGGSVSHSSSASLQLPANSVRYENGGEYTGEVHVAMSWIDPTASDLPARMVGDLSGIDIQGTEVYLGTYGMLNVELLADNGNELQLKDGSHATLSFPVPTEIRSQAPSTIPLWSYDEDKGIWIEEGRATLQGGFYVGDVAHFSSWNCDYKGERIKLSGKVISRNNAGSEIVVPFLQVYVTVEGILTRGGFLSSDGEFEFYNFPANEVFTITILDRCDNVIFEQQYGPYSNDTDLATIVVQANDNDFVLVTGSGIDCNDNAITEGYVDFELDDLHFVYPLEADGTFEFSVNVCDDTSGDINVIDIPNFKASPVQTIDLTSSPVNSGILQACDELPMFFEIKVKGAAFHLFLNVDVFFGNQNGQVGGDMMSISGNEFDENVSSYYYANISADMVTGVGTYSIVNGYFGEESTESYELVPSMTTMEVTQFGENVGDIIRGTFTGQAIKQITPSGPQVAVSGTFKAVRK